MSAIQKYKKQALQLAEENEKLREEIDRLKAGRMPTDEVLALRMDPKELVQQSMELARRIQPLMTNHGGFPLATALIEEALLKAYEAGKHSS